ncbi:MAG: hypothetical protein IPP71_05815 [Bacteroidetes bacterium]|nr:hypothetical protein [Bacteroidota bacterium]
MKSSNLLLKSNLLSGFVLGLFLLSFSSCVKDERNCIASGGKGSLKVEVFPVYKGQPVTSTNAFKDTVYIKYGAKSFPGQSPSKYELKYVIPEGKNSINITKLNCGVYYFYVVCKDSISGKRITGGANFISDKITGSFNLVVPVDLK